MTTSTRLHVDAALNYATRGLPVGPVHPVDDAGVCTCYKRSTCPDPGKHPAWVRGIFEHGSKSATTDADIIRAMFKRHPQANILIRTGAALPDGRFLVVLDVDPRHGGDEVLAELEQDHGPIPSTPAVVSGGSGAHYYLASEKALPTADIAPGLTLKGINGYAVAPPSNHESGGIYQWEVTSDLDTPIADIPDWLLALHAKEKQTNGQQGNEPGWTSKWWTGDIPAGGRRGPDGFPKMIGYLRTHGVDVESALGMLRAKNETISQPLEDADLEETVRSMYRRYGVEGPDPTFGLNGHKPPGDAGSIVRFAETDTGNAERLAHHHGALLRYCWERGVWFVWIGTHWKVDAGAQLEQLAKTTVRQIAYEAEGLSGKPFAELMKFAAASESSSRRRAMIQLARSEQGIPIAPDELDRDPWLLNAVNGTINLRTGELQPHEQSDHITRCIPTPYEPEATCPLFDAFLDTIFAGDKLLVAYMWRQIGYALTGDTSEQMIVINYGTGSNGKSTLTETIRKLLGDYAADADADTFMQQKNAGIREDIAALDGVRFVASSESQDGQQLSEALVKKMTGGEQLRARRLYENGYEFAPQFKVWLGTNHKPTIWGTDHAIWRRIRLVPFSVTFRPNERIKNYANRFVPEFPGILARAVQACLEWQQIGLSDPPAVLQASKAYRQEMDVLGGWIADCCQLGEDKQAPAGDLYQSYTRWCGSNGESPMTQRAFGARLKERGLDGYRDNRQRYWLGIGLNALPTFELR